MKIPAVLCSSHPAKMYIVLHKIMKRASIKMKKRMGAVELQSLLLTFVVEKAHSIMKSFWATRNDCAGMQQLCLLVPMCPHHQLSDGLGHRSAQFRNIKIFSRLREVTCLGYFVEEFKVYGRGKSPYPFSQNF